MSHDVRLTLRPPELGGGAAEGDEVDMAALFDQPACLEHEDAVGHRRGQPMSDGDDGASFGKPLKSPVNGGFRLRVQRGRRLVQDENRGLADERAGQSDRRRS